MTAFLITAVICLTILLSVIVICLCIDNAVANYSDVKLAELRTYTDLHKEEQANDSD